MRVHVVTLFEELFTPFLEIGMVGRAVRNQALSLHFKSPRDYGLGKHRAVDDKPYGGGAGMVMRVDCIVSSLEALDAAAGPDAPRAHRILMTPQGQRFDQRTAARLSQLPAMALVCGRYEGVDERVRDFVDEELSLGDFVLSGGEVAAMTMIDACARLLPGVLGNAASLEQESHSAATDGLLEYPHYTRPAVFRGREVPEVLQSGHHGRIDSWRTAQAVERTAQRRPDIAQRRNDNEAS